MHSYTLTRKDQKEKLGNNLINIATKRIRYLRINLPKEAKTSTQKTVRYWQKKPKTIQTDWRIYCVLGFEESILWKWLYYPKNLQFQYNPSQITNDIFHRIRAKHFTIWMETQKMPKSWSNLKKEKMKLGKLASLISDYIIKLANKFIT